MNNNYRLFKLVRAVKPSAGGIDTSDATATPEDIVKDKIAYVDGKKVVGTVSTVNPGGNLSMGTDLLEYKNNKLQFTTRMFINQMLTRGSTMTMWDSEANVANAIGLTADKIKKGVTILGITGIYEGDFTETVTPEEYTQAETQISDLFGEEV